MKAQWGVCRYCGGTENMIERRSGGPGRVCRPCRNERDAEVRSRFVPEVKPKAPIRRHKVIRMTVEERGKRIQTALEVANAKGITLVQALAIEGVI